MSATQDLIAAALTAADKLDILGGHFSITADGVREMCARAMVQPVGEVPMPDVHDYGYHDADNGWIETLACDEADVLTYGDAREAAGYARAVRESGERLRSGREILDKALRGEVKP